MEPADTRLSTKRERLAAKEAAILAAAEAEFRQAGFDGARMAEIARRADIGEGTLYLYFRTKTALLLGVVTAFWDRLTLDGARVVDQAAHPLDAFRALALFHLHQITQDFQLLELAVRLRHVPDFDPAWEVGHKRAYVAVFDRVFERAVDQGLFGAGVKCWLLRDLFFGTLDYSARTLMLHGRKDFDPVVQHLMGVLESYRADQQSGGAVGTLGALTERLERAVDRLEREA